VPHREEWTLTGWLIALGALLIGTSLFFAWVLAAQAGQADRREQRFLAWVLAAQAGQTDRREER
jgi:hypothetical protein